MLNSPLRMFATWFMAGCASSFVGIAAAQYQQPGDTCPAGSKCCHSTLDNCYLVACGTTGDAGDCNCCLCSGQTVRTCLLTNPNSNPPVGCSDACQANP